MRLEIERLLVDCLHNFIFKFGFVDFCCPCDLLEGGPDGTPCYYCRVRPNAWPISHFLQLIRFTIRGAVAFGILLATSVGATFDQITRLAGVYWVASWVVTISSLADRIVLFAYVGP